jgi:ribosome-binding factor A
MGLGLLLADRRTKGMALENCEISEDYQAKDVYFSPIQVKGISATSKVLTCKHTKKERVLYSGVAM